MGRMWKKGKGLEIQQEWIEIEVENGSRKVENEKTQ